MPRQLREINRRPPAARKTLIAFPLRSLARARRDRRDLVAPAVINPSLKRKPAANSSSCPGVRIVTLTWPRHPNFQRFFHAPANRDGLVGAPPLRHARISVDTVARSDLVSIRPLQSFSIRTRAL